MTLGPIDFIALEFPGNRFKDEILPDLFELADKEIIRRRSIRAGAREPSDYWRIKCFEDEDR